MKEKIKELILRNEIISFDIFDTLIMRKTLYPEDIFDMVEMKALEKGINIPRFKEVRIKAINENEHANPNIYEIYERLKNIVKITTEEMQTLQEMEIEFELSMCICRNEMRELLDFAINNKKKVYLITDMYLTKEIIEQILNKNGITGYEEVLISCEYRTLKSENLFAIFKDNILADSYLHIGDNQFSDGEHARRNGINAIIIDSALTELEQSTYSSLFEKASNLNERLFLGLIIAKMFNSPFIICNKEGEIVIQDITEIGYLFLGPILTEFTKWLICQVKNNYYRAILFAARDGYIVKQLYDLAIEKLEMEDMPESLYFLTSRAACTAACIDEERDIRWLTSVDFDGTPEKLLEKRLNISEEDIVPYDLKKYPDLNDYVLLYSNQIINNSECIKNGYLKYMENIGMKQQDNYAFFDFISSGTCQFFLSKFSPYNFEGLYFSRVQTNEEHKENLKIKSFISKKDDALEYNIEKKYQWAEGIITSPMPSLHSFDILGKPKYNKELRSQKQIECIGKVQEGIYNFFKDYIEIPCIGLNVISLELADKLFGHVSKVEILQENCIEEMMLIDDWVFKQMKVER